MNAKYKMAVLGGGLLAASVVAAAEPAATSDQQTINLHQAVTWASSRHPELAWLNAELQAQRAEAELAGQSSSPRLSFELADVAGTGTYSDTSSAQATLGIAWLIEGDIRHNYRELASAGTESVLSKISLKRVDIGSETARRYVIGLANQARLVMMKESVTLAQRTVDEVARRVRAGKANEAELARAEAALALRKLDAEDVEHELQSSYHQLAEQWGELMPGFAGLTGDVFKLPSPVAFAELEKRIAQNPEFIHLFSQRRVQQAALQLEKSKSSSPWEVSLGLRHFESSQEQALVAGISIPFGERSRNRAGIEKAEAQLSGLDAREQELTVKFKVMLYVLYQEYRHSLHRVEAYRDEIIPRLETAIKKTHLAYQLGRYSFLEWQSVQSELLAARSELLESSVSAHLKLIEIERLTGVRLALENQDKNI